MEVSLTAEPETDADLQAFCERARAWLDDNVPRRPPGDVTYKVPVESRHGIKFYTPEVIAANRALQRRVYEAGYAGITWPKEYGGQGLPNSYDAAFARLAEGYLTPIFGGLSVTTYKICVPTMLAHGSPDFLRDFVPKVLRGEILVCQFFSEPQAGSDLAGCRTRATKDGDVWRLNGQKIWSSFAHIADWGFLLARTNWDVPKHRGLTWFAVPCDSPGLTIRPIKTVSESSEFCEDFFDDVVIPDTYRIGEVDQGWSVSQNTMLAFERGAGRTDDDPNMPVPGPLSPDLVELARNTNRVDDPVVRQKLARAHTNEFVSQVLAWRMRQVAALGGGVNPANAAYSKLFQGIFTPIRARIAIEIGGPSAMTWQTTDEHGPDLSRKYLMARGVSVAGGTNEMQRNGIGERILGLPREPSFDTKKPFSEVLRDAGKWTGNT
jgi:alkylation response protein AidB-like acyl-CoA dehydrogenase